jgi:Cu-Zn family superoxide dismutase
MKIHVLTVLAAAHLAVAASDNDRRRLMMHMNKGKGKGKGGSSVSAKSVKAPPPPAPKCPTFMAEVSDPLGSSGVEGYIKFSCPTEFESTLTFVEYEITGLTPGLHGLHVHGAPVDPDCASTGGHWNPTNNNHGSNLDAQRHIGDLGNIEADDSGMAVGNLLANVPLTGPLGITGLSVVVHAGQDDLGLGGNTGSRAVGNAGGRPACGNIVEYYD